MGRGAGGVRGVEDGGNMMLMEEAMVFSLGIRVQWRHRFKTRLDLGNWK